MDIRNCKVCGKLFDYDERKARVCDACEKMLEDKFTEVKEYIYKNDFSSVADVATHFDIPVGQIKLWIKQERITLSTPSNDIRCEKCGAPVAGGRLCEDCKQSIMEDLTGIVSTEKPLDGDKKNKESSAKMRFL